jgi:hypothetical protein
VKKPLPFENFGRKERKKFTAQSSAYVIICETEANGFKGEEDGKTAGDCERWENDAQTAGDCGRRKNNARTDKHAAFQIFPEKEKVSPQDCGIRARKSLLFFRFFVILLKRLNFGGLREENYGKRRIYG